MAFQPTMGKPDSLMAALSAATGGVQPNFYNMGPSPLPLPMERPSGGTVNIGGGQPMYVNEFQPLQEVSNPSAESTLTELVGNVQPQPINGIFGGTPLNGFGMGGQPLAEMLGQQFQQSVTPMLQQTSDQLSQEIDQMIDQRLVGNTNQFGQTMQVYPSSEMQQLMLNTLR